MKTLINKLKKVTPNEWVALAALLLLLALVGYFGNIDFEMAKEAQKINLN